MFRTIDQGFAKLKQNNGEEKIAQVKGSRGDRFD